MNAAPDPAQWRSGVRGTVPHSEGAGAPRHPCPVGAVDAHHHIFDLRFPNAPMSATVEDYRAFKRRLGLDRSIVVAPSSFGTDNSCLLDALAQLDGTARGVAVVHPEVPEAQLDELDRAGVRGLRFYLAKNRIPSIEEVRALAARISDRGWTLQFVGNREREVFLPWEPILSELPCRVVIDHFAWAPQPAGVHSDTAAMLFRLLERDHVYVKTSGTYLSSKSGYPSYEDVDELAQELIGLRPDRILWGSDWPHTFCRDRKPDGAWLFDQLAIWAPDPAVRRQILVDNPERLYWAS